MYRLRYITSSEVNRLPPYVLLITRVGGVGERAGGLRRLATNVDAGGAGWGYRSVSRSTYGPNGNLTCTLFRFRPRDLSPEGIASTGATTVAAATAAAATAAAAAASSGVGSGGGGAASSIYAS